MQTASVLVRGWLFAAALVVILCVATADRDRTAMAAVRPQIAFAHSTSSAAHPLLIPVLGITRDALRDSFTQHRGGGRTHEAIDILAPRGTPVLASVDGFVRKLFVSRAGGLTVYEFDPPQEKVYYYAHLDRYASGLREGMPLHTGEVIGYVGTTGNAPANTPHLHFAIGLLSRTREWWRSTPLNPYPLLKADGVTATTPASKHL